MKYKSLTLLFLIILITFLYLEEVMCISNEKLQDLRKKMVEEQVKARGITNEKVLNAMLKVERHRFVPDALKGLSYEDHPLPIGYGQTISQPYIVALMTDLIVSDLITGETILNSSNDTSNKLKILEIGTGSGYQAAILAEIAYEVYTIEIIPELAQSAEKLLNDLGYKNVFVKAGDGYKGWSEKAPFDRIIVTCAPDDIPKALLDQLNPNGGKMIIPVGKEGNIQELVLVKRNGNEYIKDFITYVRFVPMVKEKNK